MKIGTLTCWLFGHKFTIWSYLPYDTTGEIRELLQTNFCVRCGKDKE